MSELPASLAEKISKLPTELFTISGKPKLIAKTVYISPSAWQNNGETVLIYEFSPLGGNFLILDPTNDKCKTKIELYDTNGNFMKGLIDIHVKSMIGSQRVYSAASEFHKPEYQEIEMRRRWQMNCMVVPGDTIQIEFFGIGVTSDKIDLEKSNIEMTVLLKKLEGNK